MNKSANVQSISSLSLATDGEEPLLDLRGIYRVLRYRLLVLAASAIIGVSFAVVYLIIATPLYTAATLLYIDTKAKKAIDIGEVVPGLGSETASIDSEVEVIRSSSVLRRVIETMKLEDDAAFGGASGVSSLLSSLKVYSGLPDREEVHAAGDGKGEQRLQGLAGRLARSLEIKRVGLSYVISVGFTFRDPEMAAKIANQVAEAYLLHQLEGNFEATKRASDWLRERLQTLQAKSNESETAVELYRATHNLVGVTQETPYDAQLKKFNEELALAQVQVDERSAKLEQARAIVKNKGELTSIDAVAQSDGVKKLREAIAIVSREEAEITSRFTDQHPKVLNKRAERRDLEKRISEEAKRIVSNLENEHKIAELRLASIEKSLQTLQDKTKYARSDMIRLKELELEAEANIAVYKAFLNRFKETTQQETFRTAGTRIITKAVPPTTQSSPKKLLTLVLGLVVSSILGTGLVFLLEHLDNRFKTREQIEEKLKLACLGSIPKLLPSELLGPVRIEKYVSVRPISAYAEAIRTINIGLKLFNNEGSMKVLMVTSARPNEGKTTVAANLAHYTAQAGTRTLLIDADLRNPSLTHRLAQRASSGLVDVLVQKSKIEQTILCNRSGPDFLPGSRAPVQAAEILGSKDMRALLLWARHSYDLVIIDTAPALHFVDARVLAELVDGIVLVIEWDQTPRDAVEAAVRSMKGRRDRIIGTVLNKVNLPRMASYTGEGYVAYSSYGRYSDAAE